MPINQTNFSNQFRTQTNTFYAGTVLNAVGPQFTSEQGINANATGVLLPGAPVALQGSVSSYNPGSFANGVNSFLSQRVATATTNPLIQGFVMRSPTDTQNLATTSTVASAGAGETLDFVAVNSGAIIVVPISNALVTSLGSTFSQFATCSWNFANNTAGQPVYGYLDSPLAGNFLPLRILQIAKGFIPVTSTIAPFPVSWVLGNVAIVKLSRIQLPQTA